MSSPEKKYKLLGYWLRFLTWIEAKSVHFFLKRMKITHPRAAFGVRNALISQYIHQGGFVADLGCGTGTLAKKLRSEKACRVIGIDQSPPQPSIEGIQFLRGDITQREVLSNLRELGVDTVVLSHVLEHLDEPIGQLKNLTWAKKIVICVPGNDAWRQIFFRAQGFDSRLDPDHRKEYDETQLRLEIESSGLSCTEISYTPDGELIAVCEPKA